MHAFCLHVNIDYFDRLFGSMKFSENYTVACYRILHKHSFADKIFGKHAIIDLTEKNLK